MPVPEYQDNGPLKIPTSLKLDKLAGKSVIVTGGGGGLGKAYAEAFVKHGAYVTIADFDQAAGAATAKELGSTNAQFVACDVTNWEQQVQVFEAAVRDSPNKSCDIVIANAGTITVDDLSTLEDPAGPPVKPNLKTMDINLTGLLYTVKLAMHYFRRQPVSDSRDRCLILKSSLSGYVDPPGSIQYQASKFGVRGVMRGLRRTSWKENVRVNLVAPWYIRTPILSKKVQDFLDDQGVGFARVEDCCQAMLFIASDTQVNGRALGVVSRQHASLGYMDLDLDDYPHGSLYYEWQKIVSATASIIQE